MCRTRWLPTVLPPPGANAHLQEELGPLDGDPGHMGTGAGCSPSHWGPGRGFLLLDQGLPVHRGHTPQVQDTNVTH